MPLDIPDGMLGQILVDLGDDAGSDIGVKRQAQVSQRFGRGHDNQRRYLSGPLAP